MDLEKVKNIIQYLQISTYKTANIIGVSLSSLDRIKK